MRYDWEILTYSFILIFPPIQELDCGTSSGMGRYNRKSGEKFCNFKSSEHKKKKKECGKAELDFLLLEEIQDFRWPHMSWVQQ